MQTKKSFLTSKGFYIAIILSIVSITVATYVAINMTVNNLTDQAKVDENVEENMQMLEEQARLEKEAQTFEAGNKVTDVPVENNSQNTSNPDSSKPTEKNQGGVTSDDEGLADENQTPKKSVSLILPLKGNVVNEYSDGEMVKSVTLNEWRTHDGIDLLAEVGTPVKAAGAGTVKDSYVDPMWGNCVVLLHGDNLETHYYNLGTNVLVNKGQTVKLGDVVGNVGATAEIEAALEPHVHFAVKKDGSWINPTDVLIKK